MQRTEESLRDLGDNIKNTNTELQGSKKKRKRNGMRKFLKRLQLKIPPTWKRKQSKVQEAQSPIQDKPKEKHAKTHTNQTNKDTKKEY